MVDDALRQPRSSRRRRRAVGPAGAVTPSEALLLHPGDEGPPEPVEDDDERLRRDLPPHHDRGV